MSRLCDSPPALDLNASAAATAAASSPACESSLRLLLVQRVDCLSARVDHLEQQLRFANATAVLRDQRIAELEERLERRQAATQLLKAFLRERDSELASRVREIATLQAMARKLRQH